MRRFDGLVHLRKNKLLAICCFFLFDFVYL